MVFSECDVWIYEENQKTVGFCAFQEDWIDQLYFLPTHVGQGLGKTLLEKAKSRHPFLQLMVFQQNTRAINFYERNGFRKVKESDGSTCEEKVPDAMYEWRRAP